MRDPNRNGVVYALTVISAIIPGHEDELRATIESLPRGALSPLARLKQLHTSRLQIFDRLVYQGAPQKRETLKNNYLLFTATIDGELDPFLDALCDLVPREADSWWRHCVAYPGTSDRAALKRWIKHNQVQTSFFSVASPNETVSDVLESLALRERVIEFAIDAQGLDAVALQQRFRATFGNTTSA